LLSHGHSHDCISRRGVGLRSSDPRYGVNVPRPATTAHSPPDVRVQPRCPLFLLFPVSPSHWSAGKIHSLSFSIAQPPAPTTCTMFPTTITRSLRTVVARAPAVARSVRPFSVSVARNAGAGPPQLIGQVGCSIGSASASALLELSTDSCLIRLVVTGCETWRGPN
jgi:hypothetical protein